MALTVRRSNHLARSHPHEIKLTKPRNYQISVAKLELGAERAIIKLPPGAGAVITNYGSGSLLFNQRLVRNYTEKVMVHIILKNAKFFCTCALLRLKGINIGELSLNKKVS